MGIQLLLTTKILMKNQGGQSNYFPNQNESKSFCFGSEILQLVCEINTKMYNLIFNYPPKTFFNNSEVRAIGSLRIRSSSSATLTNSPSMARSVAN